MWLTEQGDFISSKPAQEQRIAPYKSDQGIPQGEKINCVCDR